MSSQGPRGSLLAGAAWVIGTQCSHRTAAGARCPARAYSCGLRGKPRELHVRFFGTCQHAADSQAGRLAGVVADVQIHRATQRAGSQGLAAVFNQLLLSHGPAVELGSFDLTGRSPGAVAERMRQQRQAVLRRDSDPIVSSVLWQREQREVDEAAARAAGQDPSQRVLGGVQLLSVSNKPQAVLFRQLNLTYGLCTACAGGRCTRHPVCVDATGSLVERLSKGQAPAYVSAAVAPSAQSVVEGAGNPRPGGSSGTVLEQWGSATPTTWRERVPMKTASACSAPPRWCHAS